MKYSFFISTIIFAMATFTACSQPAGQNNLSNIVYRQGGNDLAGYLAKPAKLGKAPGIVIIHAWMGITQHEKTTADKLSRLGYYALAADIYGKGIRPKNAQEAAKLAHHYELEDYSTYIARIQSAINELVKAGADPNNIAVIGYCFGGFGAIEAARNNLPVKGIVSFHGSLLKDPSGAATPITPKVLILHGNDDPTQPQNADVDFRAEMEARNADYQMVYFGHAVHSFTDVTAGNDMSKGVAYNADADRRSWQYMVDFLRELFGK